MPEKSPSIEELVKAIEENLLASADVQSMQPPNNYFVEFINAWLQLRILGDAGREALVPLLDHPHPLVRLNVAQCLLRYKTEQALKVLENIPDSESKIFAEMAIAEWQELQGSGQEALYGLDPVEEVEAPVAPATASTKIPLSPLMPKRTSSKEELVRAFEENLLASATADSVRKANKHFDTCFKAWDHLRALGDEGREALVPLLEHPHRFVRLNAAQCLLRYKTEQALTVLKNIPDSGDSIIARIAIDDWHKCQAAGQEALYGLDPVEDEAPAEASAQMPSSPPPPARVIPTPPAPISREHIEEKLRAAGLETATARLLDAARPAIRIWPQPTAEEALACGASKFGGAPDLPLGFVWPHWQEEPLAFLAQLRLDEVAACDQEHLLPPTGMLYVFYDGYAHGTEEESDGSSRVFWWEGDPASLQRTPPPDELPDELRFPACALVFSPELTLVPAERLPYDQMGLSLEEQAAYVETVSQVNALLDGKTDGDDLLPRHRLLGHPDSIQSDVIAELLPEAYTQDVSPDELDTWRLLVQIDSDPLTGMEWDDLGRLYVCIPTADLSARRFERARLLKQSG
jgi:hypothetical protein